MVVLLSITPVWHKLPPSSNSLSSVKQGQQLMHEAKA